MHIKDCLEPSADNGGKEVYLYPGEGQGKVREILADLQANGYDGGISIEPHLAAVFHDANSKNADSGDPVEIYIEYGRKLEAILDDLNFSPQTLPTLDLIKKVFGGSFVSVRFFR